MKSNLVALAVAIISLSLSVKAAQSTQVTICSGGRDKCNPKNSAKADLSLPVAGRDVRDLFVRQPGKAVAAGKSSSSLKQSIPEQGKGESTKIQPALTINEIVSMIINNQRLPAALQGPVIQKARSMGLNPPDPSTQQPTPPSLVNHPAPHALEKLNNDNIPPDIIEVAKSKWGGSGSGSSSGTQMTGNTPNAKGKAFHRREAEPGTVEEFHSDVSMRDAEPNNLLTNPHGWYERSAEREPLYHSDYSLSARYAGPESFPDGFYSLHERDAEPEPEPEPLNDGFYEHYRRDAEAGGSAYYE